MISYSKGDLNAMSELALMGVCVSVSGEENLAYCLDYISKVLNTDYMTGKQILDEAQRYTDKSETTPVGLCISTIMQEMICVAIIFKDNGVPLRLDDPDGVLCHVHNFTAPDCSELGYCFFERRGQFYHRIG